MSMNSNQGIQSVVSDNSAIQKNGKKKKNMNKQKRVQNPLQLVNELMDLKKEYAQELSTMKTALNNYEKGGNLTKTINAIDAKYPGKGKLAILEKYVGRKFVTEFVPGFENKPLQERIGLVSALLADDLTSLFGGSPTAILTNLAVEYGPRILDWLYNSVKSKIQNYKSHGSGVGSLQYPNALPMSMQTDMNTVDLAYIASVFCPEEYKGLCPDAFGPNLCCSTITTNIGMVTDTSGNSLYYQLPDGVTQGASVTSWFQAVNSGTATANVTSGVISLYTYAAGPYNSSGVSNIDSYRVTAGSTRIVFNLAANTNSGSCCLAYAPTSPEAETVGVSAPSITQASALQFPFCHVAAINGTTEMRQIHVPHNVMELGLEGFSSNLLGIADEFDLDLVYANIIGGPASTTVARIYTTAQIDYMPGAALLGINKPQPTPEAPATLHAIAAIVKRVPHSTQLTLDEAKALASFILSCPNNYAGLVNGVVQFCSQYKSRPKIQVAPSAGYGAVGEMSFDITE